MPPPLAPSRGGSNLGQVDRADHGADRAALPSFQIGQRGVDWLSGNVFGADGDFGGQVLDRAAGAGLVGGPGIAKHSC